MNLFPILAIFLAPNNFLLIAGTNKYWLNNKYFQKDSFGSNTQDKIKGKKKRLVIHLES